MVCAGLIAYALYSQHVLGYEPCPLCILQRVAVIALGALFLLAWLHAPRPRGARIYAVLLGMTALIGALVAWRHLWIIAQPPGTVAECGASLDYMLDVLRDDQRNLADRMDAAKAAAPYVHPKLASVVHTGKDGGPIETDNTHHVPEPIRHFAEFLDGALGRGTGDVPS